MTILLNDTYDEEIAFHMVKVGRIDLAVLKIRSSVARTRAIGASVWISLRISFMRCYGLTICEPTNMASHPN